MAAALREVMEETGINMLNISEKVGESYHAYFEEDAIMLKETHWYFMNCTGNSMLKPQVEEGISEVKFVDLEWFRSEEFSSYQSIRDIVKRALEKHAEAKAQ